MIHPSRLPPQPQSEISLSDAQFANHVKSRHRHRIQSGDPKIVITFEVHPQHGVRNPKPNRSPKLDRAFENLMESAASAWSALLEPIVACTVPEVLRTRRKYLLRNLTEDKLAAHMSLCQELPVG